MRLTLVTSVAALVISVPALPQPNWQGIGGAGTPISTRSPVWVNANKSVNFDALKPHVASTRAILSTYLEQDTRSTNSTALNMSHKRATGVHLPNHYYVTISVGTPPRDFTAVFDTGSCDLFVPSVDCDATCNDHERWNPEHSFSSHDLYLPFYREYADGSTVSGKQYIDIVFVAGFHAYHQGLAAATSYSYGFQFPQFPADGMMGLCYQPDFGTSTIFQTLVAEEVLQEQAFSVRLAAPGELYFGGSNPTLYTGDFSYSTVTDSRSRFWRVTMESVEGNGRRILDNIDVVIDTGTPHVFGPPSQIEHLYSALGGRSTGTGYYTFPCHAFPTISFSVGSQSFEFAPEALNIGWVVEDPSQCMSSIASSNIDVPFWVVGNAFLYGVYTKFDLENLQVGFAKLS